MDENNYRQTYSEINELPCVYEKAILQQCCSCRRAKHFNLAERIGVACTDKQARLQCKKYLEALQGKSIFALQLPTSVDGKLPHAKTIKIQCGGVNGLQLLGHAKTTEKDVNALLDAETAFFGAIESLPYEEIVRSVAKFEGRKRRRSR